MPAGSAFYQLLIAPLSTPFNLGEVLLKATPLLLIAQGLAIGFRARSGTSAPRASSSSAPSAAAAPIWFNDSTSPLMLPAMVVVGTLFGMAWAAIAAGLRSRFNANEILVTLMLNSIALQLLYYLVAGPLRDPFGFNFPQSALFPDVALLPTLFPGARVNVGLFAALAATVMAWLFVARSMAGYRLQVGGVARRRRAMPASARSARSGSAC